MRLPIVFRDNQQISLADSTHGTTSYALVYDDQHEWHRQNPDPAPATTTNSLLLDVFPDPVTASFQLTADDCIHSLEKELFCFTLLPSEGRSHASTESM